MWILLIVLAVLVLITALFLRRPVFGRAPSGDRLERISRSPNYKNGQFQNLSPTPQLTEGTSYTAVMKEFFFGKSKRSRPPAVLPSKKTDLLHLPPGKDLLVWFGHSSYFLQLDGKKILVDPVLSGSASPVGFTTRSFPGSDVYAAGDLPEIDYLFLTHDHYDHLDYQTLREIRPRVKKLITGLGVGAHLERWGYDPQLIVEKDWQEQFEPDPGFVVTTVPGRHFSGRGFRRNGTLWLSFILETPHRKIFMGGDSGYDGHFAAIGREHGPFDLAILENGQYNKNWKYIHMMPEEVVQAAQDLRAARLLPVHWSKFSLATHAWDEPVRRLVAASQGQQVQLITPMIGEEIDLDAPAGNVAWWDSLRGDR